MSENLSVYIARSKAPVALISALFLSSLSDFPEKFIFFGMSASAICTAGLAIFLLLNLFAEGLRSSGTRILRYPAGGLLIAWLLFVAIWKGTDLRGLQQIVTVVLFYSLIQLASLWSMKGTTGNLVKLLEGSGWILAIIYALSLTSSSIGEGELIGGRSFAIQAIVLLPVLVFQEPRKWNSAKLLSILLGIFIIASLSRTAMVLALLLVILRVSKVQGRTSRFRVAALGSALALIAFELVSQNSQLSDRFFGGDRAFQIGDYSISTQGRAQIWNLLFSNLWTNWLSGHGIGSARQLITQSFVTNTEPHNDYLRFIYDSGLVGLVLLTVFLLNLIFVNGATPDPQLAKMPGAIISLVFFMVIMLTDNPFVYEFALIPLALIVGSRLSFDTERKA